MADEIRLGDSDIIYSYTEAQILALQDPEEGKLYISSDTHKAFFRQDNAWKDLAVVTPLMDYESYQELPETKLTDSVVRYVIDATQIKTQDKLRYDVNTDKLYVLFGQNSKQITDFVKGLSESEIRSLPNPNPNKIYLSADTKYLMYYANSTWNVISTAATFEQLQSDWNQTDSTKKDYIKHKPEIPAVDYSYSPTSLRAQSGTAVAGAISNLVKKTDRANYVTLGIVKPDGSSITIDSDGTIHSNSGYTLPKASTSVLGGVKIDNNTIVIDMSGTISANLATTEHAGAVKPDGTTIAVDESGVISYSLPIAARNVLGGVMVDNSTIKANSSGVLTVQHNTNDYSADQVKRTADSTSRINSVTAEAALLKLGMYKTKSIGAAAWVANADPVTSATYPYVVKLTDADYNVYSHPSWQMNGLGLVPTSTERDEIEKVKEFYTSSDATDNITLYATEQPSVDLVLEIIGC